MPLTQQQSQALLDLARVRRGLMTDPRLVDVMQRHGAAMSRKCEVHGVEPALLCPGCENIANGVLTWRDSAWKDLLTVLQVVKDLRRDAGAEVLDFAPVRAGRQEVIAHAR